MTLGVQFSIKHAFEAQLTSLSGSVSVFYDHFSTMKASFPLDEDAVRIREEEEEDAC